MAKRIGGKGRKTRYKFKKEIRNKGKISISKYFEEYKEGEKVGLSVEPAVKKGMYFPRFMGKVGVIIGKRGKCYEIKVNDQGKEKTLIAHPIH